MSSARKQYPSILLNRSGRSFGMSSGPLGPGTRVKLFLRPILLPNAIKGRFRRSSIFSICFLIRAGLGCTWGTRKDIQRLTFLRGIEGSADTMFCIRWVGTRLVCRQSSMRFGQVNTLEKQRKKTYRRLSGRLNHLASATIGAGKWTQRIRSISNGRNGFF